LFSIKEKDVSALDQGAKRLGDETSSPLFKRCVMQRRTGASALSALLVSLVAGKIYLSTNQKSHFVSLFFSQPCTVIKMFVHSPGSQLKMLMSAWTLERNLFHSKFPKNALNLRDECLLLPKNMTWLSFLVSFKKAPNYSTLNHKSYIY